VLHDARRESAALLGELEETVHERSPLDVDRKSQRQSETLPRRIRVREDAEARGITGDVVEEDGRRVVGVVEHLGDAPDVLLPGGLAYVAQLTEVAHALE